MKSIHMVFACAVLISLSSSAQTSTQRIHIKGGSSAWENFMKEIYLYPSFEAGIVEYKDGKRFKSNLNFNKALGTIQFIDEKGDTLSLSNEETIGSVTIGNDVYVYNPQCLMAIATEGNVNMYKIERIRIADKRKTGAYDIANTGGTIDAINHSDSWLAQNMLDVNETLLISKVTTFFFETDKTGVLPASKKNIYNTFSKHEEAIKQFVKANQIDFTREQDLLKLVNHIGTL